MTKWPVKKLAHRTTQEHVQHHDATAIALYPYNRSEIEQYLKYMYTK